MKQKFPAKYRFRLTQRGQFGQSTMELALVLLPFLMIVFAIIEIGRVWSVKQAVTNAAREGARIMVLPYGAGTSFASLDDVESTALTTTRDYLASAGLSKDESVAQIFLVMQTVDGNGNVATFPLNGEMLRGQRVGIRINYRFETAVPELLLNYSSPINIAATSVMQHE